MSAVDTDDWNTAAGDGHASTFWYPTSQDLLLKGGLDQTASWIIQAKENSPRPLKQRPLWHFEILHEIWSFDSQENH